MFMAKTLTEISKPLQPVLDAVTDINGIVNGFVWGSFGIGLLLAAGILMTFINKGFQFTHIGHWFKNTIGAIFADKHVTKHTGKDDKSISQFQSLCTALAATIGTGNIVGPRHYLRRSRRYFLDVGYGNLRHDDKLFRKCPRHLLSP